MDDCEMYEVDKEEWEMIEKEIMSEFYRKLLGKGVDDIRSSLRRREMIDDEEVVRVKMAFKVYFDDSMKNFLNIVHGGSIALLMENLSNASLYYYMRKCYKTISSDITYKSQLFLHTTYDIIVTIEKIKYKTVFIEGAVIEEATLPSLGIGKGIESQSIPSASVSFIKEVSN